MTFDEFEAMAQRRGVSYPVYRFMWRYWEMDGASQVFDTAEKVDAALALVMLIVPIEFLAMADRMAKAETSPDEIDRSMSEYFAATRRRN